MAQLLDKIAAWFKPKTTANQNISMDAEKEMSPSQLDELLKWGDKCADVPYAEMSIEQKLMTFRYFADLGDAEGQFQLGMMYNEGLGVKQDIEQALVLYRRSAEQGFPLAQYNLGCMHDQGLGVVQSRSLAIKWYLKAANQGLAKAQYNLGVYYAQVLTPPNPAIAVTWYQKSAEQGYIEAQYNLGLLYAKGIGIAEDQGTALTLFRKAAKQGHANALAILKLHKLQLSR